MNDFVKAVAVAAQKMGAVMEPTPAMRNDHLSGKYGADIWLKREDLSPVRSYKMRGAYNFFRKATARDGGPERFVCASAGNHAQGFAYVCRHLRKSGTVFMPVTTPHQKIDKTRAFGGEFIEIRLVGDIFDACNQAALDYARDSGAVMVPPFDHDDIIEGQAAVAHELFAQMAEAPDIIVIPVGGGGLASGMTAYAAGIGASPRFVFVEPTGAPSLKTALEADQRVRLDHVDNFVDGAAVAQIGERPFAALRHFSADDVLLVPENRLCATMIEMLNVEGVVLEPAGALAIDALKDLPRHEIAGKRIAVIVSGGNFDFERLPDVKERALRHEGLKKYFVFRFPQRPGALRDFLELLGPDDDIARFEYLKKSARNFGSVLIGIETTTAESFTALTARFDKAGIEYQDITDNQVLTDLII